MTRIYPDPSGNGGGDICLRQICQPDPTNPEIASCFWTYSCEDRAGAKERSGEERRSIPRPEPDRRETPEEQIARNGETGFVAELKAFAVSDAAIVLVAAVFIIGVTGYLVKTVKVRRLLPGA